MRPPEIQLLSLLSAASALADHVAVCPHETCGMKDMLIKTGMTAATLCAHDKGADIERIADAETARLHVRECFEVVVQQATLADGTLTALLRTAEIAVGDLVEKLRGLDPRVMSLRN